MEDKRLSKYFGPQVGKSDWRAGSYGFLEGFVAKAVAKSDPPNTDAAVADLVASLVKKSDQELAFLVAHCGLIPDYYSHDGSEETLYTKLTEVVVAEWGSRVGFTTKAQKEKSSKEDVTFDKAGAVIVSDVKSYRLGRSQKAPNVKDTIKQGDYQKWLTAYPKKKQLGGLVTFPSSHDWEKSSDVYLYTTNPTSPILLLFYEHLSFFLLKSGPPAKQTIDSVLGNYKKTFADGPFKEKAKYWERINNKIQAIVGGDDLFEFLEIAKVIRVDAVKHAIEKIEKIIAGETKKIESRIAKVPEKELRLRLVESEVDRQLGQFKEQLRNIVRFRLR